MTTEGVTLLTGLSAAEKVFVRGGVADNCRVDGRKRFDIRPIQVATDVQPSALGSARVRNEESDVICTISADLATPSLLTPNEGKIYVSVNFASPAAADVKLRAFNDDAKSLSRRLGRAILYGPLHPTFVPRSSLVLVPYRFVWRVCVDVMVLSLGGSLQDIISFAVVAALRSTRLPGIKIVLDDRTEQAVEESFDYSDLLDEAATDVAAADDDLFDLRVLQLRKLVDFDIAKESVGKPFPHAENVPIIMSIGQVDEFHLCDMTHEERASLDSMFGALVNATHDVVGLRKVGSGAPVPLSNIASLLPLLRSLGGELMTQLNAGIMRASQEKKNYHLMNDLLLTV